MVGAMLCVCRGGGGGGGGGDGGVRGEVSDWDRGTLWKLMHDIVAFYSDFSSHFNFHSLLIEFSARFHYTLKTSPPPH